MKVKKVLKATKVSVETASSSLPIVCPEHAPAASTCGISNFCRHFLCLLFDVLYNLFILILEKGGIYQCLTVQSIFIQSTAHALELYHWSLVAIVLSLAGTLYLTLRSERESLDNNLLNSATILARVPLIRDALTGAASSDTLADFLDEATAMSLISISSWLAIPMASCSMPPTNLTSAAIISARPSKPFWKVPIPTLPTKPAPWAQITLPMPPSRTHRATCWDLSSSASICAVWRRPQCRRFYNLWPSVCWQFCSALFWPAPFQANQAVAARL